MDQSGTDPVHIVRLLQACLDAAMVDTPVVCLLGPRQCGKSTVARRQAQRRHNCSVDEARYLALVREDPEEFVGKSDRVFYDGDSVLPLCGGACLAVPLSKLWKL